MSHKVYLVEQHIGSPAVGWRILAEKLPIGIEAVKIGLSTGSNTECLFPLNKLHDHDYHAAGHGEAYVQRVLNDVTKALKEADWTNFQNTGYTVHEIVVP